MNKMTPRKQRREAQKAAEKAKKKATQNARRLMADYGDPVLSTPCESWNGTADELRELMSRMSQVCESFENGVGLAAPQVGRGVRVIMLWPDRAKAPPKFMINPTYSFKSEDRSLSTEGCLSYYAGSLQTTVFRHSTVDVDYTNADGELIQNERHQGFSAFVVQHEMDHLDGKCVVKDYINRGRVDDPSVVEARAAIDAEQRRQRAAMLADVGSQNMVLRSPGSLMRGRHGSTLLAAALLACGDFGKFSRR